MLEITELVTIPIPVTTESRTLLQEHSQYSWMIQCSPMQAREVAAVMATQECLRLIDTAASLPLVEVQLMEALLGAITLRARQQRVTSTRTLSFREGLNGETNLSEGKIAAPMAMAMMHLEAVLKQEAVSEEEAQVLEAMA